MIKKKNSHVEKYSDVPVTSPNKRGGRCFNCGRPGHLSEHCRYKNNGPKCFKCGQYGHKADTCTTKLGNQTLKFHPQAKVVKEDYDEFLRCNEKIVKVGEYPIKALIDTGSDRTLIVNELYKKIDDVKTKSKTNQT